MEVTDIIPHLDFANHHPNATQTDIQTVCNAVNQHHLNSAFMNPSWVEPMRHTYHFTGRIGTIVAFSLGQDTLDVKLNAAKRYIQAGANELDIMLNVSNIKMGKWTAVSHEIESLVSEIKSVNPQTTVKCVPECGYLDPDEIKRVAALMAQYHVDFFKTCTGMGPRGAILDDVKYVKEVVGDQIKIKVAGGIETRAQAEQFLEAGADRIGTSHALQIIAAAPPQSSQPSPNQTE